MDTPAPAPASARPGRMRSRTPARGFWRLREPIPKRLRVSLMVVSVVVPLAAWVILSGTKTVDPLFLPTPTSVFRAFQRLWSSGTLQSDMSATLTRVGIGFALVVVISVPLGVAIGTFESVQALFEPMIGLLRYMPAPAFIPLLIIWLGLGESSKITLLVVGTVFFNTLMSADAAGDVPKELIDASYTLGATRWTVVRKVVVPHALPGLIDAMRVNIAATWNLVVVAELIAAQSGLGYRIVRAQRFLQTDQIFAVLIVIGVIGVAIDLSFRALRNVAAPWAR
ncbi:MAG: sulfonate/nitrate/taurine transporter permease [Acidimicrobiales bacterium]|jgi:NitT/TauT family transport system permease protein|nr:sulfonate/nitrate/taurine transporter permease [Acidimicrobiales bacterium]